MSNPSPNRKSRQAGVPRWVVAMAVAAGALVLAFVAVHLAGGVAPMGH